MVSYKECRQFFDWMSFKCKGIIQYHSHSTGVFLCTGASQKYTHRSCTHPLHRDNLGRRRSAVTRGGRCCLDTGNVQQDS